jgi:zona occludens toxin (predicted ATPase)
MQFEGKQHWHIQRRDISLEEELARGKFAIIFKAKLYVSKNMEDHVVAKTLQGTSIFNITKICLFFFFFFLIAVFSSSFL